MVNERLSDAHVLRSAPYDRRGKFFCKLFYFYFSVGFSRGYAISFMERFCKNVEEPVYINRVRVGGEGNPLYFSQPSLRSFYGKTSVCPLAYEASKRSTRC